MSAQDDQVFFGQSQSTQMPESESSQEPVGEEVVAKANVAMYKQNVELAIKNKTLSVLRTMYAITMMSLDVSEVSQRIVDTIVTELSFSAAWLALVRPDTNTLQFVVMTRSPEIQKSMQLLGRPLNEIVIPMDYVNNLIISAFQNKQRGVTGNLLDIFVPVITQEVADEIEKTSNIKTLIVYPLFFGQKTLGALVMGISRHVDDLSRAQRESIDQLMDVIGIAIERAELHEDLVLANKKLQELDKLKDEFVSLASHELRTPMTAIRGSISTVLEGYAGEVSAESKEFLTAAYNENDRLIRLVNNLLNISRIEAGRFIFTVTDVNMDLVVGEVVRNLTMAAQEKSLTLEYKKESSALTVKADEDKVREVLINLIGNAIKFTHKGGVTVTVRADGKSVVTSVADTGSGIAKEDQDLLFKKFSQIQGSYAKQTGGTGLGLYICKKIIEGLGGKVWLESTLGKGSTFFFSLPTTVP